MTDQTQHQSDEELQQAQRMSLKPTSAPGLVPGYSVRQFLGSGAFGEVWSGVDRKTGRQVAIKFYTRRSSLDLTLLSREVEKLAALSADRYVVQLLDVGWDAEPPYYVMDFITSGSLEDELSRDPRISVEKAVDIFRECAVGLVHLHGKGILHCDLKPGNILLDQDHKPRLADFGQSRLSHEQSPSLGTLFYMAPEQANLQATPDARWDVYALGALLYRMLTGYPPYRDEALVEQLESASGIDERLASYRQALAQSPPPNGHRRVPGVDRMLAEIIDRCIAVDPDKRFRSVHSVLLALRQRDHAHARRPLMIVGILGPVLLLAGMSIFGWNFYRHAVAQTNQAVMDKAIESNRWAAQLAARSAGEQIDNYFWAVERMAADPEIIQSVSQLLSDSELTELRRQISDPNRNTDPSLAATRKRFVDHAVRKDLQALLEQKVKEPLNPLVSSWFICDRWGNQLAADFTDTVTGQTIGLNYAWRSYFNADVDDSLSNDSPSRYLVAENPDDRIHIDLSHLSGVFRSQGTATWKIAFSTPLIIDGQFAGIVALTTTMGNFIEFENQKAQYAMMVDARPGKFRGVILEHPKLRALSLTDPNSKLDDYRIDVDRFENKGALMRDPLVDEHEGDNAPRWVAAMADIKRTSRNRDDMPDRARMTGLAVISAQAHGEVIEPVRSLERQLSRLALGSLGFILAVVGLLVFMLSRTFRQARRRVVGGFAPATDSALARDVVADSSRTG
jgi:hypothetical protein